MARLNVVPQIATSVGAASTPVASTVDGHMFDNDGQVLVVLSNTTGGSVNVTFVTPNTVDGLAIPDRVVAVGAAAEVVVGHFDRGDYNQPAGADSGKVYVNFPGADALVKARYLR